MIKQSLVSIIIPFYNEMLFLERAINSTINQTHKNIEVILVDDGSTDDSNDIASKFCNKHNFLKLIAIQNSGISCARNIGLENCSGDFVVFLDADDELLPKMIETLLTNCLSRKSDVVVCKFDLFNAKGSYIFTQGFRNISSNVISKKEASLEMYNHNIAVTVWAKIYRIEIAKAIKFPENLWFEDRLYLLQCFLKSNRISFVHQSLLKIHPKSNSITRKTITAKRITDQHKIFEQEMDIAGNESDSKLSKVIANFHLSVLVDTFFLLYIDKKKIKELTTIRGLYLEYITKFKKHYKQKNIPLNFKKNVLLRLITLPIILPWNLSNQIVKTVLFKKFKKVELLKN